MKKWTKSDSWDSIMNRLEELEEYPLPYNNVALIKENYRFVAYPTNSPVRFTYCIENYYTTVSIWFSDRGHIAYNDRLIAVATVDKYGEDEKSDNVFSSKKAAVVFVLNKWEKYIAKKEYEKHYERFLKFCKYIGVVTPL